MGAGMTLAKRRLMLNEPHLVSAQSDGILTLDTDMRAPLKALRVGFEPVQDLHGYDKPWPAGGGKNKAGPMEQGTVMESKSEGSTYSELQLSSTTRIRSVDLIPIGDNGQAAVSFNSSVYEIAIAGFDNNGLYLGQSTCWRSFKRTSPQIVNWTNARYIIVVLKKQDSSVVTDADRITAQLQVEVDTTTATAYDPYSNICPITGWDGVTVGVNGKNYAEIKPFSDWVKKYAYSTIDTKLPPNTRAYMTLTDKDASVDVSGVSLGFIDSSYTGATTLKNDQFRWVMQNGRVNSNRSNIPNNNDSSVYLNGLFIYPSTEAAYNKLVSRYNIMVELSPTATAYEPYQGTTVPVSWTDAAGTVYKGHAVINRDGSATVTATMASVDAGTLTWGAYNAPFGKCFYGTPPRPKQGWRGLSSDYVQHQIGFTQIENGEFTTGSGAGYAAFVRDDRYASGEVSEFKAAMQGVQFVYELATPVTYTLTPQEVLRTLRGENNLWSDANGAISATFWKH